MSFRNLFGFLLLCTSPLLPAQVHGGEVQPPRSIAPSLPLREALALAEARISPKTYHVCLAELRTLRGRPHWALLFERNEGVDDGHDWVTVDMAGRVVEHGMVIHEGPEVDLHQLPLARTPVAVAPESSVEILQSLPVDRGALGRLKGPETLRHGGRAFKLDLTGWHQTMVCDGPHMGPDGGHVVATYGMPLPGLERDADLTIWLLPEPRVGAPFDPLPWDATRTTESRVIRMGGLPGTLQVTGFDGTGSGRGKSRIWYVSAEQTGPGWRLRLEIQGTVADPSGLVKELTRIAKSLRCWVGMPLRS